MKILFGSIITRGAGRLGGHCVRNFKNNAFLQRLPMPINRKSPVQMRQRQSIAVAGTKWKELSNEQREAWALRAETVSFTDRWGNPYFKTGRNLFMSCYPLLALPDIALPSVTVIAYPRPTFFASSFGYQFTIPAFIMNDVASSDVYGYLMYAKVLNSDTQYWAEKDLKYIGYVPHGSSLAGPMGETIFAAFPSLDVFNYLAVGIKAIQQNGLSAPMVAYTTFVFP